jgi:hypothetical protein
LWAYARFILRWAKKKRPKALFCFLPTGSSR